MMVPTAGVGGECGGAARPPLLVKHVIFSALLAVLAACRPGSMTPVSYPSQRVHTCFLLPSSSFSSESSLSPTFRALSPVSPVASGSGPPLDSRFFVSFLSRAFLGNSRQCPWSSLTLSSPSSARASPFPLFRLSAFPPGGGFTALLVPRPQLGSVRCPQCITLS